MQGLFVPGYGIVTLVNSNRTGPSIDVQICYLPSQIAIFEAYIVLAILSFFLLMCEKFKRKNLKEFLLYFGCLAFIASNFYLMILMTEYMS